MDETSYRTWSALHVRTAGGEILSPVEQVVYEAGMKELEQGEVSGDDLIRLMRRLRKGIAELTAECEELRAQRQTLAAEITQLEARLDERTRRLLCTPDEDQE
jgi:chromosome segregation ATPase